ncbi:IS3 family transposase [Micrococcus luteus]|nr:IS3 family transposase [Micrococcus luteus]
MKSRPASARALRDTILIEELKRIHAENYGVYGVRKMHHAMRRAGWEIGRDQVARLMKLAGVEGVRRGRTPITTRPAGEPDARPDLVERCFTAERPNQLWVADITYVRTISGFCYVAFITDVYSRRIVGWSAQGLAAVAYTLNNRPRKVLDWKTPAEVFAEQLRSLSTHGVATTG